MKPSTDFKSVNHPGAKEAFYSLLAIKDSDIRLDTIYQGNHAVDQGIHIGGSFSETVLLVTMFYGGFIHVDVSDPTAPGNDIFVLSKGHCIAAMASVYADEGFFDRKVFDNCRCYESILNAHPGPTLPGVHIATGPLGQGISVAVGFALTQKLDECGRTFCIMGDGELQEGIPWEAFMYAENKNLSNLCLVIDHNQGQNDHSRHLMLSLGDLKAKLEAFGFEVLEIDGASYMAAYEAFAHFATRVSSRPMAIISNCTKGQGGSCVITESHKATMGNYIAEWEVYQQESRRKQRVGCFLKQLANLMKTVPEDAKLLLGYAQEMHLEVQMENGLPTDVARAFSKVKTQKAPVRDKRLRYREGDLPDPKIGESYKCSTIAGDTVASFSRDPKIVTLDADMGLISGLQIGMEKYAKTRALNTGIAESNMMGIAEAFAARGYNAWCSTFGVFFDWRVLRRITVSQQERLEVMAKKDGWLSEGHGLDITFFATAANIDTTVNGATHMGIDDVNALMQLPCLKVIDVACPRMMVAAMKWIAQGNKGLVLLRLTRQDTVTIYDDTLTFEYAKGYVHGDLSAGTAVITSGRGIYEGLKAQEMLKGRGIGIAVVDMPSFDENMALELTKQGKNIIFAEQNNGFLFASYLEAAFTHKVTVPQEQVTALSTRGENRKPRHLHSGAYAELTRACKITAEDIVNVVTIGG